ncbi:hypothetical protein Q4512_15980 [Oceanihabitans sp. 2_MG-2023]|uniref:hypothetical protein n=1 Tax=Oceanihabitans sp. 2_MG-2023 TaxID=3062661 RepID=UPI0026E2B27F|nr:hypothetical protein [Oceanihabitans sp. 2_MG-2023]MDO6598418.1 hypothetical protein [Oceanihabitans sp. 2_MG-2023]
MKTIIIALTTFVLFSFSEEKQTINASQNIEVSIASSFSLVNDTKEKVSIYTGTGFVSLNKGSKTSISCNTGKEVRWANKGKKGDVIFKIESKHCGKTIKLSDVMD